MKLKDFSGMPPHFDTDKNELRNKLRAHINNLDISISYTAKQIGIRPETLSSFLVYGKQVKRGTLYLIFKYLEGVTIKGE